MNAVLVVIGMIFVSLSSVAAQKNMDANVVMAKATAGFVNRMANVEQYLMVMSKHISPEQMDNFKKQLSLNNISPKSKFPKMSYDGNKVFFDKNNYIMYIDANTVNVNGHVMKKGVKGLDVVYKEIMQKIGTKKSVQLQFIPEAHALSMMGGLLGTVASGALGYFLGPSLGLSAGWGAALGAGAFFLGNELYQSFRSGEVSCDGMYYVYRSKTREGIFASSNSQPMDSSTLGRVFGPNIPPCNKASAQMVEQGVKNFGTQPQPLGYPPYVRPVSYEGPVPPQPAPGKVIGPADVSQ